MVNKCSVSGCKSLYVKDNVKLHRFPLTNTETLPIWIAATGREKEWKPCKSSRLCGHHFQESEYIVGHGKGILKSTAIPTIDYRVNIPRYNKKIYPYIYNDDGKTNTRTTDKSVEKHTSVEIVQLDSKDKCESKSKIKDKTENSNDSNGKLYIDESKIFENNEKLTTNNEIDTLPKLEDSYANNDKINTEDNNNRSDTTKTEYDCQFSNYEIKSDICNRENQCYMFTSSFKEDVEPIILAPDEKPSEVSSSMNIDQSIADSKFNKIMALKLKKQRRTKNIYSLYFKSLKKKILHKHEKIINSFNDETASFGAFIEAQMKELRPHKKLYLTTKHKIQKVLMKAQLRITN